MIRHSNDTAGDYRNAPSFTFAELRAFIVKKISDGHPLATEDVIDSQSPGLIDNLTRTLWNLASLPVDSDEYRLASRDAALSMIGWLIDFQSETARLMKEME